MGESPRDRRPVGESPRDRRLVGERPVNRRPMGQEPLDRRPADERLVDGRLQEQDPESREADERRKARAEARARYRAVQKRKRMIILSAFALLLLIIVITIVRCSIGNENGNGNDADTNGAYNENEDTNAGEEETPQAGLINQDMQEIYYQDGVAIYFVGFEDDFLGTSALFFIRNDGDIPINVQSADVSANGFMITGMINADVMPDGTTTTSLTFSESDLVENGIEAVETMDIRFEIRDKDTLDVIQQSDIITIRN